MLSGGMVEPDIGQLSILLCLKSLKTRLVKMFLVCFFECVYECLNCTYFCTSPGAYRGQMVSDSRNGVIDNSCGC